VEHAELAIEFGFCMRATQSNTRELRVQPQVSHSTCDASGRTSRKQDILLKTLNLEDTPRTSRLRD